MAGEGRLNVRKVGPSRSAALLLAFAAFAPAFSALGPAFAAGPSALAAQQLDFPTLPPDLPPGAGALVPCEAEGLHGTARCGRFRVFENREEARGRTLDIAFVVLEALEPSEGRDDGIIVLPGGPGEALTPGAVPVSHIFPELRERLDIVLVDVRGVGRSHALACDVPFPGGLESRFQALFPLDHAAACRDTLSERARLDLYTTATSVDDLEDLRRWLGYRAWNLVGGSYGTRVAQVYMRRHPDAVRTVTMNGVAAISEPSYVQDAHLLERALDRLLAECENDPECRDAFPDVRRELDEVLRRFAEGPVEVELEGRTIPFTAGALSYALRGLLYVRGGELPMFIHEAARGDVAPLAEYYLERTAWVGDPDGEAGYHFSVLCAEDIAPVTDEDVERLTRGTFMGDHLIRSYREACGLWPHAELPPEHFRPVESDVPTLLLSGGRDPVTPPEGGEAVARHLPDHLHVVVPNGGHGVGGPCIEEMVVGLILSGSLDGLDPSCVEEAPPTGFKVPEEDER